MLKLYQLFGSSVSLDVLSFADGKLGPRVDTLTENINRE